jgi:hypothetical protein
MRSIQRYLHLAAMLALPNLVGLFSALAAQSPTPVGTWKGTWNSPDGSVYAATVQLSVASDGSVDGSIDWKMMTAQRADLIPKIGMHGTEYVRGTFDARCRVLTMAGYKLDDPHTILGMDQYELVLAPNGAGLGGVTANHDAWTGMLSLRR